MLIEEIIKKLKIKFHNDNSRLEHIFNVNRTAIKLSKIYKVNLFKTQIAALLHDYTKNEPLDFHCNFLSSSVFNKFKLTPYIYHAFSAALVVKKEFKINDIAILNAIKKHVWGHKKMTKLDKIILLSDKIEPNRKYEQISYFRKLSFIDLHQAVCEILQFNYNLYKQKGYGVHMQQLEVIEFLKNNIKKTKN